MIISILIALLIFVVAWIVIGIVPLPAHLEPLRTVLYVVDAVLLILYLWQYI